MNFQENKNPWIVHCAVCPNKHDNEPGWRRVEDEEKSKDDATKN